MTKAYLVIGLVWASCMILGVFTLVYPENDEDDDYELPPKRCISSDGTEGFCQPLIMCVYLFQTIEELEQSICDIKNGDTGVCCPSNPSHLSSEAGNVARRLHWIPKRIFMWLFQYIRFLQLCLFPGSIRLPVAYVPGFVPMDDIKSNDLDMAMEIGTQYSKDLIEMEMMLWRNGLVVQKGSKEAYHLAFFGRYNQEMAHIGTIGLQASMYLAKAFKMNKAQIIDGLSKFNMKDTNMNQWCPKKIICKPDRYRTFDGSCNNLEHPEWGKSFTALQRFLPPRYADGLNLPRNARDQGELPSAREISSRSIQDEDHPSNKHNLILMQWAQFLDHDLTLTTLTRTQRGEGILCCHEEVIKNPRLQHPACLPIDIPATDTFYSNFKQRCMEFVRSLPALRSDCSFGPREQMNQLTSFLDGSNIYGSTQEQMQKLRSNKGGKLKVQRLHDKDMLPLEMEENEECRLTQTTDSFFCFKGGDERVNEQLNLAAMHTVWMREHNRIALSLSTINPDWNDETIFQETRKIVIAQLQHITYNEFLPIILGRTTMQKFQLMLTKNGYSESYDPSINPTIANAFAAAAFRFGHTLVQGRFPVMSKRGELLGMLPLSSQFFNPAMLTEPQRMDNLLLGLVNQPAQQYDRFITKQLTNHLFQQSNQRFGMDLVSLNIQRARDHGIPGYNEWRSFCQLPRIKTFEEMSNIMAPNSSAAFRYLYRHVDDIDLFPAGVSEYSLPNATLGPTFGCIVAEQFRRLKKGDRHWYENGGFSSSFTLGQLEEIRKTSLSRILCDNADDIDRLQPLAFLKRNPLNRRLACRSRRIPRINLSKWKAEN